MLEQSLGSHEQALGSLKTEYQRKQEELREAEEEVKKLRTAVTKKVQTTYSCEKFLASFWPGSPCSLGTGNEAKDLGFVESCSSQFY